MAKRNVLLDMMRGWAIILVVLGHAGVSDAFRVFIYSFHMPLFFFISGFFCSDRKNIKSFLFSKWKSLYVPFATVYSLLIFLSHWLYQFDLTRFDYDSLGDIGKALCLVLRFRVGAMDLLGHFWFLPVLFFISIIFYGMLRLTKTCPCRKFILVCGGAIFTCAGVLMIVFHLPNPYDLHRVCYYMGFYMLGWLIAQQGVTIIKSHYGLGLSLLLLMVVFSCVNNTVKFYPLLAIFMAVVGIGFSWLFMEIIQKIRFCKRILEFIGQHTMTIFIWHVLAFKMIEYGLSIISPKETMTLGWGGSYATHSLPLIMIYTLGGILLPLGIVQIKNKIFRLI